MSIWRNLNQIDGLYQCQSPGCDVTLWLRKEAREGHSASLYGTAHDCMWLQSSQNYESQRQTQTVLCSSSCPCSSSWSFHSHHLCPLSLALQLLFKCHPFLAPLRNHFPRVTNSAASVPPVRASSHVHDLHPLLTCHSGGILLPCSASHLPTPPTGPSNVAKSSTLNYRTSCTWSGVNGLEVISSMFSAPMINLWFRQEAFSPVPPPVPSPVAPSIAPAAFRTSGGSRKWVCGTRTELLGCTTVFHCSSLEMESAHPSATAGSSGSLTKHDRRSFLVSPMPLPFTMLFGLRGLLTCRALVGNCSLSGSRVRRKAALDCTVFKGRIGFTWQVQLTRSPWQRDDCVQGTTCWMCGLRVVCKAVSNRNACMCVSEGPWTL